MYQLPVQCLKNMTICQIFQNVPVRHDLSNDYSYLNTEQLRMQWHNVTVFCPDISYTFT